MEKLICDKCNKEFILEAKDIKHKTINSIEVQYFECKHCNEKYITTCIDDYIIKEQQRYKCIANDIQQLIRLTVNNKKINITKYDKKLKELKDSKLRCLENMKIHSDRLKLNLIGLI